MKIDLVKAEAEIISFWEEKNIYEKAKNKVKENKPFYFLDGPPYTTGRIHVGHAWGKSLKDLTLRYLRMNGYNVHDKPGYDVHGLPIEVKVEEKIGLKNKKEIKDYGVQKFVEKCISFAKEMAEKMNEDFSRLGIWMDWDNPYYPLKNTYIQGAWTALKKAYENNYLYRGKKVMTWCARCATALAKHELEYEDVTDKSIFVKFRTKKDENTYLLIWTTTPWTIPCNMGVMVHPDFVYAKVKVNDEYWIVAEELVEKIMKILKIKDYEIVKRIKGSELEEKKYEHVFSEEMPVHKELKHIIVLSKEYVDLDSGTGLVHCAPGCGPEDYEVGIKYKLSIMNPVNENGVFSGEESGRFKGWNAKKDDKKWIKLLKKKGLLAGVQKITHEYPTCWRCHEPVIFRATKQWFLKTSSLRNAMREKNKKIFWQPDWAGNKWFDSWLSSLQDWCISRQRYWGIPLPIWKCEECNNIELFATWTELYERSGYKESVEEVDLHKHFVDKITFKCKKCDSIMRRDPDILDVWLDSGAAPWASIGKKSLKSADLIIEGKDQIRGWFNSLMCLSMVAFKKPSYKRVYMHGFINDAEGKKMSKSKGNVVSPDEVVKKWGADTFRFYTIGGVSPGLDLNYNFKDMKLKNSYLRILYNMVKFVKNNFELEDYKGNSLVSEELSLENQWMVSRINNTLKKYDDYMSEYKLYMIPRIIEDLMIEDLSRWYFKIIKNKISEEEVLSVLGYAFKNLLLMCAPVIPYSSEYLYQELKDYLLLDEESIHLMKWPKIKKSGINEVLEEDMSLVKEITSAILNARSKAGKGIRWPLKKVMIFSKVEDIDIRIMEFADIVKELTNVKEIEFTNEMFEQIKYSLKPVMKKMGKKYGEDVKKLLKILKEEDEEKIVEELLSKNVYELKEGKNVFVVEKEDFNIKKEAMKGFSLASFSQGEILLDLIIDKDLKIEGYSREITRRIQSLRKKRGLSKDEEVKLYYKTSSRLLKNSIKEYKKEIEITTNTELSGKKNLKGKSFSIKDKEITLKII